MVSTMKRGSLLDFCKCTTVDSSFSIAFKKVNHYTTGYLAICTAATFSKNNHFAGKKVKEKVKYLGAFKAVLSHLLMNSVAFN